MIALSFACSVNWCESIPWSVVRDALACAREFMLSASDFDPWSRICVDDPAAIVKRYVDLFEAHMARRKEESYQRFRVSNQRVRSTASVVGRGCSYSVSVRLVIRLTGALLFFGELLEVVPRRRLLSGLHSKHPSLPVMQCRQQREEKETEEQIQPSFKFEEVMDCLLLC